MKTPPNTKQISAAGNSTDFRAVAGSTLRELVSATAAVIACFRDSAKTAADLSRLLGIPRKAAWQFFRIAESKDPFLAANFVPGDKPMRDLIQVARREGVTENVALRLQRAYGAFDQLVNKVAGDRTTFLAMLGDAARDPGANADVDRQHRIQIFKSYSHFFGMHANCSSDVNIIKETVMGQRTRVELRSVAGFCRLRPDAQCVVERHKFWDSKSPDRELILQPLDVDAFKQHGVPVLPAFCSKPMPTLVVDYGAERNTRIVEWAGDSIGTNESVDVTTGIINCDSYPPPADGDEHGYRERTRVGYPVKRMTQTWLLHMADTIQLLEPRLKAYLDPEAAQLTTEGRFAEPPRNLYGGVEFFPAGSWSKLTDRFTGIRELVAYTCALMRWDPADFTIVNLEIDYPLVNSVVLTEIPWIGR